jgi:hypothetical protein
VKIVNGGIERNWAVLIKNCEALGVANDEW